MHLIVCVIYCMFVLFVVCSADTTGGSQMGDGLTRMYGMWNVILSKRWHSSYRGLFSCGCVIHLCCKVKLRFKDESIMGLSL